MEGSDVLERLHGAERSPSSGIDRATRDTPSTPPRKLRVGVVGCGRKGHDHVRALSGLPWVSAIWAIDPDAERRSYVARKFSWVQEAAEMDGALEDLDAVIIAAPVADRARLAVRCVAANKHVLVEAPAARTSDVVHELHEQAVGQGVVLAAGYGTSAYIHWSRIREVLATGDLGRIHLVDAVREGFGRYRPGSNALWDLGPDLLATVSHALTATPSFASAWGRSFVHDGLHDVVDVTFEYADLGVPFRVRLSWLNPIRSHRVTFVGERGMLVYEVVGGTPTLTLHQKQIDVEQVGGHASGGTSFAHRRGEVRQIDLVSIDAVTALDSVFTDTVRGLRALPSQLRTGVEVVSALAAAQRSIDETSRTEPSIDPSRILDEVPA